MKKTIAFLNFLILLLSACSTHWDEAKSTSANVFNRELLPSSKFSITTDRDTIIQGVSGTSLLIKKNTFADQNGKAVNGKIEIELKEALSMEAIVMGNLTTVSNGNILQSGGMIYIDATSNREKLSIAESKSIEVVLPTKNKKDSMQLFTGIADPQNGQLNWVNPQPLVMSTSHGDTNYLERKITNPLPINDTSSSLVEVVLPEAPSVPQQIQGKSDTIISLVFDTTSFPELAEYRNVKFKLMDKKNFSSDDSKHTWMTIDLKKVTDQGLYTITFAGYQNQEEVMKSYSVMPVFEPGEDYEKAMLVYDKKYKEFENKKKRIEEERLIEERKQKLEQERLTQIQKLEQEKWEQEQIKLAKQSVKADEQRKLQAALNRNSGVNPFISDPGTSYIFTIQKLGWANIDRLYTNPTTRGVELVTEIQNFIKFDNVYISLVIDNEMIYLPGYQRKDLTFGFTHSDLEPTKLPIGSPATIIATGYIGEKLYVSFYKFTILPSQKISLELKETTDKDLMQTCKTLI